jgi:hypothetical protein
MKAYIVVAVALSFVLTTSVCQARLGETEDQCIARWGQPVSKDHPIPPGMIGDSLMVFQKGRFSVDVLFLNGVVAFEIISDVDNWALSDVAKQTLLDSESDGLTWNRQGNPNVSEMYTRSDRGVLAIYEIQEHKLQFISKAYFDQQRAKMDADQKAKLKGF